MPGSFLYKSCFKGAVARNVEKLRKFEKALMLCFVLSIFQDATHQVFRVFSYVLTAVLAFRQNTKWRSMLSYLEVGRCFSVAVQCNTLGRSVREGVFGTQ